MEQIRRRHLEKVRVQVVFAEAGLRHGDGRLQQAGISDPQAAAVPFNLVGMNFGHLLQGEEPGSHRLVR